MALLPAPAALDTDGQETAEWRDAFTALVATHGPARARFDSSGKLRLNADGAGCNKGPVFVPEQVDCTQGAGNKADCYGQGFDANRTRWKNPFRRSE